MSFTYSDILNDIDTRSRNARKSVTNIRETINSAVRKAYLDIDFKDSIRRSQTVYTAYDQAYYFPLPSDLKGESIITIEQVRHKLEASYTNPEKEMLYKFDANFPKNNFVIDYNEGTKWLKWNASTVNSTVTLHKLNDYNDNGTWAAADNGTNLKENKQNYLLDSASISCDMSAAGTVLSIENTAFSNAVDISANEDHGSVFVWVYVTDKTYLSSVTIYWGSDSSNYWYGSATTPFDRTAFKNGWNLIAVDWASATQTGSPLASAVDYAKISLTFSVAPSTLTGYLFNNLFYNLGNAYELSYYSYYAWQNSSGTWLEKSTADSDVLNADVEAYEVILDRVMLGIAQAIPLSSEDTQLFLNDYERDKSRYCQKYPSRIKKLTTSYYKV